MERTGNHDELLESKEFAGLIKKLEDHMKNAYEEACKKNVRNWVKVEISLLRVDSALGMDNFHVGGDWRCIFVASFTVFGNSTDIVVDCGGGNICSGREGGGD